MSNCLFRNLYKYIKKKTIPFFEKTESTLNN